MDEQKEKFDESEILIWTLGYLIVDGACTVIDFIPVIGWVVSYIIQTAGTASIEWLESRKGGGSGDVITPKRIGKYLLNVVPWIPTLSGIFLVSALIHNNLAAAVTLHKTLSAVGATKGVKGIGGKIKAAREAYTTSEI